VQLADSNSEKDKLYTTINKHKERIDSLLFSSKKLEKDYASLMERYTNLEKVSEQRKTNPPPGFPSSNSLHRSFSRPREPITNG
jgi:hypothetical protein